LRSLTVRYRKRHFLGPWPAHSLLAAGALNSLKKVFVRGKRFIRA
jgi:hypothetical protein